MILYFICKYELWWFACPKLFKMMWAWHHLWWGKWWGNRFWKLIFSRRYAEGVCRYLLGRLNHYAPAEVFRIYRDGTWRWDKLQSIMKKHNIEMGFV